MREFAPHPDVVANLTALDFAILTPRKSFIA
jgi:hypothetical protein